MAVKKTKATPIKLPSEQQTAVDLTFPHAVEAPYLSGWEHALTEKYGVRGKRWTSTKSEPQWTVRFKEGEAATWFKNTWTTGARIPADAFA